MAKAKKWEARKVDQAFIEKNLMLIALNVLTACVASQHEKCKALEAKLKRRAGKKAVRR